MKYIKYLLILILFIPYIVFAKDSVEIKSISLVEKSEDTIINNEPTFNGLTMNYDISFRLPTDYVKYKVLIHNDTDTEYNISEDTSFNNSNYISYKYEVDDILKAKSEITIFVTITYNKKVDESLLVNNRYTETNQAIVQLLDQNNEIVPTEKQIVDNPKTAIIFPVLVLLVVITSCLIATVLILNKKNVIKYISFILLISICLLPIIVNAIESLKLTINTNIEIQPSYKVGYLYEDDYIKESDLKKYDLSNSDCEIRYINSVSEENKYYYCSGSVIRIDDQEYYPNDKVELKSIQNNYLMYDINHNLEEISEGVFLEYGEINSKTVNKWRYGLLGSNSINNYIVNIEDKNIMNFEIIYEDYWELGQMIYVNSPQTFTMPDHNILFIENIPAR